VKYAIALWIGGFGFALAQTFVLDRMGLLHTPLHKGCDAVAMALMAGGIAIFLVAAARRETD
jgi:hypothetical protein